MTTSSPNRSPILLPQDVLNNVIDQCWGDVSTLRECALVSSRWRPAAQWHLFFHTTVTNNLFGTDLLAFLRFLDKKPALRFYIHILRICCGQFAINHILDAVARLPNLRGLHMDVLAMSPYNRIGPKVPVDLPKFLEWLDITECGVSDPKGGWNPLFELINSFSSIGKLRLSSISGSRADHITQAPTTSPVVPLPRAKVGGLYLHRLYSLDRFGPLVFERLDLRSLRTLFIAPQSNGEILPSLDAINASTQVECLGINFERLSGFDHPPFVLTSCKHLETIVFVFCLPGLIFGDEPGGFDRRAYSRILETLSSLPFHSGTRSVAAEPSPAPSSSRRSSLKKIRFKISLGGKPSDGGGVVVPTQHIDWNDLQSALERFDQLQTVEISFYFSNTWLWSTRPSGVSYLEFDADSLGVMKRSLEGLALRCKLTFNVFDASPLNPGEEYQRTMTLGGWPDVW